MPNPAGQRACPLCGATQTRALRELRYALFDDLECPGDSPLLACKACGFVFNDPHAGAERLNDYYRRNDHYLNATTAGSGGDGPPEQARYRRLRHALAPQLNADSTILDIGCGKGGFLRHLADSGYRKLYAVEASDACRRHIRTNTRIEVAENIAGLPAEFAPDCVVLSHVLEHLYDPLGSLTELVDRARPGSRFYIEVPNTPALLKTAQPWTGFYFEHVNHFDAAHLAGLAVAAGLEIEMQSTWAFSPGTGCADECVYLIGRKPEQSLRQSGAADFRLERELAQGLSSGPLTPAQLAVLDSPQAPLAVWGISQYVMLILGLYPQIGARITGLFDRSPAKIGRRIGDIPIEPPEKLAQLAPGSLLLLPVGGYAEKMAASLPVYGFNGRYRFF